jgi:hypothetical protein
VPAPVPFVVLESAVVGFGDVLQQTPRAVTLAPPVTFPPLVAVVWVMAVTGLVAASVGMLALFKFSCFLQLPVKFTSTNDNNKTIINFIRKYFMLNEPVKPIDCLKSIILKIKRKKKTLVSKANA